MGGLLVGGTASLREGGHALQQAPGGILADHSMDTGQTMPQAPLFTPDGRYLVVRGRLWRAANPGLSAAEHARLVKTLMAARRQMGAARRAGDRAALALAAAAVEAAKHGLGERGPVWWHDGAPDYNRHLARNTPYADWYAAQQQQ